MIDKIELAAMRSEYTMAALDEAAVARDPFVQFDRWLAESIASGCPEPSAMSLATVNARGHPSSRIVLLKEVDANGFVFYTNYLSRKGVDLAANPHAALMFYWVELERQIRIEGSVSRVEAGESDAYHATRPVESRIAAWASPQSEVIANRAWLERRFKEAQALHGEAPPRPPHWGGYRLVPTLFEFWQGRRSRLHDRVAYARDPTGWRIARLAP